MKLAVRLGASMAALVAVTAAGLGYVWYRDVERSVLPIEQDRLGLVAASTATDLVSYVRGARSDVLALRSTAGIAGLARSLAGGGRDPIGGTGTDAWVERIVNLFVAMASAKEEYVQIRVIGTDREGRELIRVDRSDPGGSIRVVPDEELQAKGDRPYFDAIMSQAEGDVYVSPIELNQETGRVQVPHLPVMRLGTPIYGPDSNPRGILIINVDMRPALARIQQRAGREAVVLINADGDYVSHPDSARTFGYDLGERHRLQDDYPWTAASIAADSATWGRGPGPTGDVLVAFAPLRIDSGPRLMVAAVLPVTEIAAPSRRGGRSSLYPAMVATAAALLFALFLARSVAGPVSRLTAAVEAFPSPPPGGLPTDASGETGTLARTFERMSRDAREKTEALEREIRERQRAETALLEKTRRERLLSEVVDSSDDAILTKTTDGVITAWNPAAEQLYGWTSAEVIGQPVSVIVPAERQAEVEEILRRINAGERVEHFETVRKAKDGRLIPVSVSVSPLIDQDLVIGAATIARDLRQQKSADRLFRATVEAAPSGMVVVTPEGRIVLVNAEAIRLFGYTREEFESLTIEQLVPEGHRSEHAALRARFAETPSARSMGAGRDLRALRKDGTEFPAEIGLNPVEWDGRWLVLAVVNDVGPRRAAEEALERHARDLQRSNAELEQFAYVASHDLQEPLRMVVSYTELLAERYAGQLDEKADKFIHYAVDGAKRMQILVRDLLAYSRVGTRPQPFEPVDLNDLVRRVVTSLSATIEEAGADVEIDALPQVRGDGNQLAQLIQNLVSNAVKFRADEAPRVRISTRPAPGEHVILVEDNGIGIDKRHAERIFQMFQRLHERGAYEGSGIGLAIARKIVDRHGGRIWFESQPGKGTTFFVALPESHSGDADE